MSSSNRLPDISVVIPAHNEAQNLPTLVEKIAKGAGRLDASFEIILIDDGSTDKTQSVVSNLAQKHPELFLTTNHHKSGISASVTKGIKLARGKIVVFLPADLQSDPEEDIPKLLNSMSENVDVVAGIRKGRADGRERSSWLYNGVVRLLFSIDGQDLNWIKAARRELLSGLELRAGWYRLLVPILVARGGRMTQVETNWYPRVHGKSKFSPFRFIPFLWDIVVVRFLVSRWSRDIDSFLLSGGLVLISAIGILWAIMKFMGIRFEWPLMISVSILIMAGLICRALLNERQAGLGLDRSPDRQQP